MYKISVVVPIYNVQAFLPRCMDSLRHQTIERIEVLMINDHGTDDSISIAERYIEEYGLEVHWHILSTPKNSGPAIARNIGIEAAQGEYVAFCDADDWIEPNMYETLYQQACQYDADISSAAAILDYPDGTHRLMTNPQVGNGEMTIKQRKLILKHFISNFTTMLFRREWIVSNHLCFPDSRSGEDSCFMGMCYLLCRSIAQNNQPLYHYIIHEESISHRKKIYRGDEKKKAFSKLLLFAHERGLWTTYRWELIWIYIKKAIITSIIDYIKAF